MKRIEISTDFLLKLGFEKKTLKNGNYLIFEKKIGNIYLYVHDGTKSGAWNVGIVQYGDDINFGDYKYIDQIILLERALSQ